MRICLPNIAISVGTLLERLGLEGPEIDAIIQKIELTPSALRVTAIRAPQADEEPSAISQMADSLSLLEKGLEAYFLSNVRICFEDHSLSPAQRLAVHWHSILERLNGNLGLATNSLFVQALDDTHARIFVPNEFLLLRMKEKLPLIRKKIEETLGETVELELAVDPKSQQEVEKLCRTEPLPPIPEKPPASRKPKTSPSTGNSAGKMVRGAPVNVSDLSFNGQTVTLKGTLFHLEVVNSTLLKFGLYDGKNSVRCLAFRKVAEQLKGLLHNDATVLLHGQATRDAKSNEGVVYIDGLRLVEGQVRMDDAPEPKHVELHVHTQMSAMDSIVPVSKLVERVASWGHDALGITDHGVVQAFPEFYEACNKHGIKPVFGMEGYLVDVTPLVYNLDLAAETGMAGLENAPLRSRDFVVLDFETTGLSPIQDEIIEIGAVKVSFRDNPEGEVLDKFEALIQPSRPLPEITTKITGITPEMLQGKPSISKVLPEFVSFLEGCVLVAHNANFDYRFLQHHVKSVMDRKLERVYLDTLSMARSLLQMRSYTLDKVVKRLGLESFDHHRAFEDAAITSKVFLKLLALAFERGCETFQDLDHLKSEIDLSRLHGQNVTLFVQNRQGLKNLYRIVSQSHLEYFGRHPLVPKSLLESCRDGLLIGSGGSDSELASAFRMGQEPGEIQEMAKFYDFIELMPPDAFTSVEERVDPQVQQTMARTLFDIARSNGMPVIMSANVHYLDPGQHREWSVMKISETALRRRGQKFSSHLYDGVQLHLRTTAELLEVAEKLLGDAEKARQVVVEGPRQLVERIEEIAPISRKLHPPVLDGADEEIRKICFDNMHKVYGPTPPQHVKERLERELDAIVGNGYAVLYLIAQKIVQKSREDGYMVGSRGSVGSSLVATMLDITEVNPMPPHYVCPGCKRCDFVDDDKISSGYDLPDKVCPDCGRDMEKLGQDIPFETFMGFKGNKVPDIDLNFSGEYQSQAHKYLEELFGSDHVFRAGTISTVADKTAFGYVLRFEEATGESFPDIEKERIADTIAGVKRTTGQHPGGLMIVPRGYDVFEFTAVQHPANDSRTDVRTTHFDYHSIHDDLVKIDALGHDDPTFMRHLQDLTGMDPTRVPMDDPGVLKLFNDIRALGIKPGSIPDVETGTLGIPEFGTGFVRGMLKETRPSSFADLVRISGLSHGTDVWLGNIRDIIVSKRAPLREVVACRDDIMNDLIHKGMEPVEAFNIMERVRKGKGLTPEEEQKMKEHGLADWFIDSCKKIKYLFPKAHAVAYVSMAFRVAYFKLHHPLAFYATYFTIKGGEFNIPLILSGPDKIRHAILNPDPTRSRQKQEGERVVNEIALEMLLRGFCFLPVDITLSHPTRFEVESGKLRIPLTRVSGLGLRVAQSIITARQESPFVSIEDLNRRTGLSSTLIETLKEMGALGDLSDQSQFSLF